MSEASSVRGPLVWEELVRPDGVHIRQARARNNSWYLIVPSADGTFELRYASQSANTLILNTRSASDAQRAAETHADRYDTRV